MSVLTRWSDQDHAVCFGGPSGRTVIGLCVSGRPFLDLSICPASGAQTAFSTERGLVVGGETTLESVVSVVGAGTRGQVFHPNSDREALRHIAVSFWTAIIRMSVSILIIVE